MRVSIDSLKSAIILFDLTQLIDFIFDFMIVDGFKFNNDFQVLDQ